MFIKSVSRANLGKISSFGKKILERGGNRYKSIAQKFLAVGVSFSLAAAMVPRTGTFADGEPTTFIASAKANHWGRSDLRSYLNNVTKTDNTLPLDSTSDGTNGADYPSHFTDTEYAMVKPFTYSTNVLSGADNATSTYEATDKFWLPSGGYGYNGIVCWGADEVSRDYDSTSLPTSRIVPVSFWPHGGAHSFWTRSPNFSGAFHAVVGRRGQYADYITVDSSSNAAAASKLNLSSVLFASAASAASVVDSGGSQAIATAGSSDFGVKTRNALPSYGMYLKTESTYDFTATDLSLSGSNLDVSYDDGVADQYVVVHAFKEDSLTAGHTSYAAAGKIASASSSVSVNVSAWGLSSLDGYTIKVWMEDATGGSSLAPATSPATFVGSSASITKTDTGAVENLRVFALQDKLQCSWGTLANKTDLIATDATYQKIYFGSDSSGNPLEFWIAGREDYGTPVPSVLDGDGTISSTGDIMTLYQAKSVEQTKFNASSSNYDVTGKSAVTLQLEDGQSGAAYPDDSITFKQNDGTLDTSGLKWQHRASAGTAWTDGMPSAPGTYQIRCCAEGTANYERTYSAPVTFTVIGTPTATDFTFTPPTNLTYDGQAKTATVTVNDGITGMGEITVKYYQEDGTTPAVGEDATTAPTDVGTYRVKIDVAAGTSYGAATGLTDATWKFTIDKATPTYDAPTLSAKSVYYGATLGQAYSSGQLKQTLGSPQLNSSDIAGTWTWVDGDTHPTGTSGIYNFKAQFTPAPGIKNNYDWTKVTGWDSSYEVIYVDVPVTVTALPLGEDAIISLSATSFTYNGTEQTPTITVKKDATTPLTEGTDYDVTWPTDKINAGDKSITVNFKGNYIGTAATQYTISPAELTPSISAANKTYDGKPDATVTVSFEDENGNAIIDLIENTDYEVSNAKFADANAGTGKDVSATVELKSTNKANNYTLTSNTATVTADISQAELTVTLTADDVTYGENVVATATVTGLQGTDALTDDDKVTFTVDGTDHEVPFSGTTTTATIRDMAAGDYDVTATITLAGDNATNYTVGTIDPITVVVDQKDVTVTADNKTKIEGENDPELTYAVDPTTPLVFDDVLTGELTRDAGETAGIYAITQGTLTNANNPNYNITFNDGTLTITAPIVEEIPDDETDDEPTIGGPVAPETDINATPIDTLSWGEVFYYSGIKHYIDANGMTSVEVPDADIFWLREESEGTSAWYGLRNPIVNAETSERLFEPGSRFYVHWLNAKDYPEEFANVDDATLQIIEGDNGWLFKVGVIKPDGTRYEQLPQEVELYVQIGDDWDLNDLQAWYITSGEDIDVQVESITNFDYPDGKDEFGVMKLNHFSPYLIIDKVDETATKSENSLPTGDQVTYITISGLGLMMTLALGLMFKTNFGKRKFND